MLYDPTKIPTAKATIRSQTNKTLANPPPFLDFKVLLFNPNQLKVELHLAINQPRQWLLYSDVWHPFWKAWVNGKPAKIYRANLAYKAVQLETGNNTVEFKISAPNITVAYFGLAAYSIAAFAILILMLRQIGRTESP